jgi:hypothetical protein
MGLGRPSQAEWRPMASRADRAWAMETKLGQVVAGDIGVEGLGLEAGRDAGRMEVVEGSGIDQGASDGEVARA